MRTLSFDPEDECVINLLYAHIDFNQLECGWCRGWFVSCEVRELIGAMLSELINGSIVPMQPVRPGSMAFGRCKFVSTH